MGLKTVDTSRVGNFPLSLSNQIRVASRRSKYLTPSSHTVLLAMPLGTRSSQSTQPARTQKRRHAARGARNSADELDGAPASTQAIDEDEDLDNSRGVNNEVGHSHIPAILQVTPRHPGSGSKSSGSSSPCPLHREPQSSFETRGNLKERYTADFRWTVEPVFTSKSTVLGNTPRAFKDVLECAQGILRTTFGMQLVELQSRAELDREEASKESVDGDRRKATGVKKKGEHGPQKPSAHRDHPFQLHSRRQWKQKLHPALDIRPHNPRSCCHHRPRNL
jgi:hypothetical protein